MEGNQEEGRTHWQNKRCWFLQLQAENVSKEQWLKVERSWNGEEACESGAWVKVSTSKKNSFLKNYEILCSSSEKILFEPVTIIHHFMCWEMLVILRLYPSLIFPSPAKKLIFHLRKLFRFSHEVSFFSRQNWWAINTNVKGPIDISS